MKNNDNLLAERGRNVSEKCLRIFKSICSLVQLAYKKNAVRGIDNSFQLLQIHKIILHFCNKCCNTFVDNRE